METTDQFNNQLVNLGQAVDTINKDFYSQFSYPWPPKIFPSFHNGGMMRFVNQSVGCFDNQRLKEDSNIWVAGCGTNQAIFTALRYPKAKVLGTDVSTGSLNTCRRNAQMMGIKNLTLLEKSINDVNVREEFDFIICTGVIHHNASPAVTLAKIVDSLKRDGVMELMVYNFYHRLLNVSVQKAINSLINDPYDFQSKFDAAKSLIKYFPVQNLVGKFLNGWETSHPAAIADALIQPVEYSYTVETLETLLDSCNLTYIQPCYNESNNPPDIDGWNLSFEDSVLSEKYNNLTDSKRWNVTNLLLLNDSPMLWFYLQKKDANVARLTEEEICKEFLRQRFTKFSATYKQYIQNKGGEHILADSSNLYPNTSILHGHAKFVYQFSDPSLTMNEVFTKLKISPTFKNVNRVRLHLTTSVHPFLDAVN
jgi:2-polyprenyl-3-methyl-5-hydroxy-6-metoxy-1,4-benzoquinol methylase